jgi:hypothetical protein
LQERFETFIRKTRYFESIDELLRSADPKNKKRADYLVWGRRIIIEQKVLVEDPFGKAHTFINRLLEQRGILAYGTISTNRVFAGLPDGEEQKRRMFLSITKSLEASFASADKQTRDTREVLSIPDAIGIVVLLNAGAPTLYPAIVQYGLNQVLQKRKRDGCRRYPHNDGVIMISEVHVETSGGRRGAPCFSSPTPQSRDEKLVREFSSALIRDWAIFNGVPMKRQDSFWL